MCKVEVLWSRGIKKLCPLFPLLVKGRNLYRLRTFRQVAVHVMFFFFFLKKKINWYALLRYWFVCMFSFPPFSVGVMKLKDQKCLLRSTDEVKQQDVSEQWKNQRNQLQMEVFGGNEAIYLHVTSFTISFLLLLQMQERLFVYFILLDEEFTILIIYYMIRCETSETITFYQTKSN